MNPIIKFLTRKEEIAISEVLLFFILMIVVGILIGKEMDPKILTVREVEHHYHEVKPLTLTNSFRVYEKGSAFSITMIPPSDMKAYNILHARDFLDDDWQKIGDITIGEVGKEDSMFVIDKVWVSEDPNEDFVNSEEEEKDETC
jgi:hypothetical protein